MQRTWHNIRNFSIVLLSLLLNHGAIAAKCPDDLYLVQQQITANLKNADQWDQINNDLVQATGYRLKYPLQIISASGLVLPVNSSAYLNADLYVSTEPHSQGTVIRDVNFEYSRDEGKKRIGHLNYVVLSEDQKVIEIGAGSEKMLDELESHLFGRVITLKTVEDTLSVNSKLFDFLRNHPIAKQKIKEFERDRGWPEGLAEEMKLVYFNDELTPLKLWARENRISFEQLEQAGWMQLRFDRLGKPYYKTILSDVIKIPYFLDSARTKIITWRNRVLNPRPGGAKYLSTPLDFARNTPLPLQARLYNSWLLSTNTGKPLVITEGEFKTEISTITSGILHQGVPGITEFDDASADAIFNSQPSEVIVVFDRDPRGSALARVDELTDSERAAYSIARRLEARGLKVRIATLPDVFGGSKVGADDLILKMGVELYKQTLDLAVNPDLYAEQHGLDRDFQKLFEARQTLARNIAKYSRAVGRGAAENPVAEKNARIQLAEIDRTLQLYFRIKLKRYNVSLQQPSANYPILNATRSLPSTLEISNPTLSPEAFSQAILLLEFSYDPHGGSFYDQLAQHLAPIYPVDDFVYTFDVSFSIIQNGTKKTSPTIPIIIRKKGSNGVRALVDLRVKGELSLRDKVRGFIRP